MSQLPHQHLVGLLVTTVPGKVHLLCRTNEAVDSLVLWIQSLAQSNYIICLLALLIVILKLLPFRVTVENYQRSNLE